MRRTRRILFEQMLNRLEQACNAVSLQKPLLPETVELSARDHAQFSRGQPRGRTRLGVGWMNSAHGLSCRMHCRRS